MKLLVAFVLGFVGGALFGDAPAAKKEPVFAEQFCFQAVRTGALTRCYW